MPHSLPDSFHSGDKVSREVNDRDSQPEHEGLHKAPPLGDYPAQGIFFAKHQLLRICRLARLKSRFQDRYTFGQSSF